MRVLISGYYGFGNLGDEALLAGLVAGLKGRGFGVTVLSADPAGTRRLHGADAAHRLRGALPALFSHDAFVSGGGGLLQDKTSRSSLRYYLGLLQIARKLGKRVAVYGQSVGPLSPWGREAVAKGLKGVSVAVRDEASRELLAELGVPAALSADSALLLPAPPRRREEGAPVLLVPRGGYPEISAGLAFLAKELTVRGHKVAALLVQPSEDGPCLRALLEEAPELSVMTARTPAEALAQVGRARYVVSGRLHGLVFAAVAHLGFSGLVYDPKVAAFLDETARPAHPLPLDRERLLADVLEPSPLDTGRLEALKQRAEAGLGWLGEVLRTP